MIYRSLFASVAFVAMISSSLALAQDVSALAGKQEITFTTDTIYPESASWSNKRGAFFVGSVRLGTVGTVDAEGNYKPFITDDALVSTVGVLADDAHDAVWVANADPGAGIHTNPQTQGKLAGIGKYDATTGDRLAYYDLSALQPGAHLANDIVLDAEGNGYVTDSFAPIIYKIGVDGKPTIFVEDARFHTGDGFNLNGIAYNPAGFLLVGKYNSGELFKVSISNPQDIASVRLPAPIVGADGFNMISPDRLAVTINAGFDKTIELTSTDGWQTASIVRELASVQSMPSAVTKAGDDLWVLNSRLDTLLDPKAEKVGDYLMQKF